MNVKRNIAIKLINPSIVFFYRETNQRTIAITISFIYKQEYFEGW